MRKDLTGSVFGRLTAHVLSHIDPKTRTCVWECVCVCGEVVKVKSRALLSSNTRSCGCLHRDTARKTQDAYVKKHGQCYSDAYRVWRKMLERCCSPSCYNFDDYGGRGITVCPEWLFFENFYRDMGDRPSRGHSLDRIDNNGNYCKENCRWATKKEQANNRRSSRMLTHNHETKTLTQWAESSGIGAGTIAHRIKSGWPVERALTQPVRGKQ